MKGCFGIPIPLVSSCLSCVGACLSYVSTYACEVVHAISTVHLSKKEGPGEKCFFFFAASFCDLFASSFTAPHSSSRMICLFYLFSCIASAFVAVVSLFCIFTFTQPLPHSQTSTHPPQIFMHTPHDYSSSVSSPSSPPPPSRPSSTTILPPLPSSFPLPSFTSLYLSLNTPNSPSSTLI